MPHDQPVVPVEAADGHAFELIRVPAACREASLLFLPGMGISARHYIGFGRALAERGIEVFIHEWRGLGSSTRRAERTVNWGYRELLELDLMAALDTLGEHHQGPLLLGGHSLGSQFACLLAARHPESCRGIVIVAGGAPYWREFPWAMKLLLGPAFFAMPSIAAVVGHYPGNRLGFAGREARGVVSDWARTGRSGVYQAPGLDPGLEVRMAELERPVLGLRLEKDWFVPAGSLAWLTGKLEQCQVRTEMIPDTDMSAPADHYGWMHSPEAVSQRIAAWLTDLSETD